MNKRIRKKLKKRFGIFHYNDFKPTNPNVSVRIIDTMNYISIIHSIDGKMIEIIPSDTGRYKPNPVVKPVINTNKTIYQSSKFID